MPGDDRFAQAEQMLEAGTPKFWDWEEDGLRVVGEVIDAFVGNTKHKDNVPVLILRLANGDVRSVWGTGVLGDKLLDLEASGKLYPADVVGIERGAEQETSKGGNDYWPFKVTRVPGPLAPKTNALFGQRPSAALPEGDGRGPTYADIRAAKLVEGELEGEVVSEVRTPASQWAGSQDGGF